MGLVRFCLSLILVARYFTIRPLQTISTNFRINIHTAEIADFSITLGQLEKLPLGTIIAWNQIDLDGHLNNWVECDGRTIQGKILSWFFRLVCYTCNSSGANLLNIIIPRGHHPQGRVK